VAGTATTWGLPKWAGILRTSEGMPRALGPKANSERGFGRRRFFACNKQEISITSTPSFCFAGPSRMGHCTHPKTSRRQGWVCLRAGAHCRGACHRAIPSEIGARRPATFSLRRRPTACMRQRPIYQGCRPSGRVSIREGSVLNGTGGSLSFPALGTSTTSVETGVRLANYMVGPTRSRLADLRTGWAD